MADTFRHHHHRLRPGRLRHRDPRGAARLQDRDRRARLSRRHLLELGLHPDQGAAALGRDLPLHAARQGLRAVGRQCRLRSGRRGQALARRRRPDERRRRLPDEEEQGPGDLGRGRDRRARQDHREGLARPRRRRARSGPAAYQAKHIIVATGARPRVLPGLEPDKKLVWTYFEAMDPDKMPKSLLVIGSGAIGIEFASFYRTHGRRGDGGRGAAADPAGRGRRDRRLRPQGSSRSRASRSSPAPR